MEFALSQPVAPDCRVVYLQAARAEQLFDIAGRERVPQAPVLSS